MHIYNDNFENYIFTDHFRSMDISPNQIITIHNQPSNVDFLSGCLILVDKPHGWTSFDVVNKIRHTLKNGLQIKKIKVGHAGTLDPMATGLLLICTGKLTKQIDTLLTDDKCYSGTLLLGATTPTYDAESEADIFYETEHIQPDMIHHAAKTFLGYQEQIPPIFSAIKIKGRPAYDLARKGKEVVMQPRPVTIHTFDILQIEEATVAFRVTCTKGTYIRSLAHDLGKKLSSGAHLTSLRREGSGTFLVQDALTVEQVCAYIHNVTNS